MDICVLPREEQAGIYPDVWEMLNEAEGDFVPPLSQRSSSTQQILTGSAQRTDGVQSYFAQLKTQRFAAVFEEGKCIAFVSYKEDYTCDQISEETLPNIYLTTLIVRKEFRGRGVTTALYEKLFSHYANVNIFTRTWSTNHAHIRVLQKYAFSVLTVLPNHRGPGTDTVYFVKNAKGLHL